MEYYQKIRNIREDMDIKQYQFANRIHVFPKTYNLYESGTRSIPYCVLDKILKEFQLSLDYLLELSEQRYYPNLNSIVVEEIPKNFKRFRKNIGLSQKEMAVLLNCSQQTLSGYERGKIHIPLVVLKKFCQITHISADTVCGRTKEVIHLKRVPSLN